MKIDRLVSIIMVLLDKNRIGAQELADMFEVSLRTIYRDIDAINMAGIPVRGTSGVNGGFEIMPEYKLDKKVFSAADLSAILMGLSSLSNMIHGDELINALAKVTSFIPADRAKDIALKANQIFIDLSPWMGNRNMQPYLEKIKAALQESRLLSFEYADRYGNKTTRTAEPYQLVLKSNHWYLQGFAAKEMTFVYSGFPACQSCSYRRKLLHPGIFKSPSWNLRISWPPCSRELKSASMKPSGKRSLITALRITFLRTVTDITSSASLS